MKARKISVLRAIIFCFPSNFESVSKHDTGVESRSGASGGTALS